MALVKSKQIEGGGSVNPEHVAYVSPSFNDVFPYYSTITAANAAVTSQSIKMIEVFPGDYAVSSLSLEANLHCHPGVTVYNGSSGLTMNLDGNHCITGNGRFYNFIGSNVFKITGNSVPRLIQCDTILSSGSSENIAIWIIETTINSGIVIDTVECGVVRCDCYAQDNQDSYCLTLHASHIHGFSDSVLAPDGYIRRVLVNCDTMVDVAWEFSSGNYEINFSRYSSDASIINVTGYANLTLRHGTIFRDKSGGAIDIFELASSHDVVEGCCTLEQVSMRCLGTNIDMSGAPSKPSVLHTKNCTFCSTQTGITTYSIVGNDTNYCLVRNMGGGSCATYRTDGVSEFVSQIYIDGEVKI